MDQFHGFSQTPVLTDSTLCARVLSFWRIHDLSAYKLDRYLLSVLLGVIRTILCSFGQLDSVEQKKNVPIIPRNVEKNVQHCFEFRFAGSCNNWRLVSGTYVKIMISHNLSTRLKSSHFMFIKMSAQMFIRGYFYSILRLFISTLSTLYTCLK